MQLEKVTNQTLPYEKVTFATKKLRRGVDIKTRVYARVRVSVHARARVGARAPCRVQYETRTGFVSNLYGFHFKPVRVSNRPCMGVARESLGRPLETPEKSGELRAESGGVPVEGWGGSSEGTRLCTTLTWVWGVGWRGGVKFSHEVLKLCRCVLKLYKLVLKLLEKC